MSNFTSPEAADITNALLRPVEEYVNDANIEEMWAIKAFRYAETHINLLKARAPRQLKLTKIDDQLYADFSTAFPNFSLDPIIEAELKSEPAKVQWREFCNQYKELLNDFDIGTLLRIRADGDYTEENTLLVMRVQYFAIEIARNRTGINDKIHQSFHQKPPPPSTDSTTS